MLRMDMLSREQYLKTLLGRYLRTGKWGKSAIFNEYCRNTGMARKSVLRKLSGLVRGEARSHIKRSPVNGRPVRLALETLWEIFDRLRGQRLKPMVEEELKRLRAFGELEIDKGTAEKLKQVSPATMDRLLAQRLLRATTPQCARQGDSGGICGSSRASKGAF
jgi:hypothetical protein